MDRLGALPDKRPVIDVTYVEIPDRLTHRVNLGSIYGAISFFALIACVGAVEENPVLSLVLAAVFTKCVYLSLREDGKIK